MIYSSGETTDNILKTLLTLASNPEGGKAFSEAEDWTPLIEIAPKQPYALAILSWSWLHAASATKNRASLSYRIDKTIYALIASYKGTDAVTLLDFIDKALGRLGDDVSCSLLCFSGLSSQLNYKLVDPHESAMARAVDRTHKEPRNCQAYSR